MDGFSGGNEVMHAYSYCTRVGSVNPVVPIIFVSTMNLVGLKGRKQSNPHSTIKYLPLAESDDNEPLSIYCEPCSDPATKKQWMPSSIHHLYLNETGTPHRSGFWYVVPYMTCLPNRSTRHMLKISSADAGTINPS